MGGRLSLQSASGLSNPGGDCVKDSRWRWSAEPIFYPCPWDSSSAFIISVHRPLVN